jgi:hypothetical protein
MYPGAVCSGGRTCVVDGCSCQPAVAHSSLRRGLCVVCGICTLGSACWARVPLAAYHTASVHGQAALVAFIHPTCSVLVCWLASWPLLSLPPGGCTANVSPPLSAWGATRRTWAACSVACTPEVRRLAGGRSRSDKGRETGAWVCCMCQPSAGIKKGHVLRPSQGWLVRDHKQTCGVDTQLCGVCLCRLLLGGWRCCWLPSFSGGPAGQAFRRLPSIYFPTAGHAFCTHPQSRCCIRPWKGRSAAGTGDTKKLLML